MADIFLASHGQKLPQWPDAGLIDRTDVREKYILALQASDKGNYGLLEQFTRDMIVNGRTRR